MNHETQTQAIAQMTETLLESDPGYFLVEAKITAGNHIRLFVDGDNGISIDRCVLLSRSLYKQLEESSFFADGAFSLEVSSPGLDEPLKLFRQYKKNIGRNVEVLLTDGTRVEGKLVAVEEHQIEIEEFMGRKKEVKKHIISLQIVKTTKIQVVF